MFWIISILLWFIILLPQPLLTYARRTSVDDMYQARVAQFDAAVAKLSPANQKKTDQADVLLDQINQAVCSRFSDDTANMAAILDEYKNRKNLAGAKTTVAYGQGQSQLDQAEYWLNYAEEAVAYQKIQYYPPNVSGDSSVNGAINASESSLRSDLGVLKGKILKAKAEVSLVIGS